MNDPSPTSPTSLPDEDFRRFMLEHKFGMEEVVTKLSILRDEFTHLHDYNPIENVTSRLKSVESLVDKVACARVAEALGVGPAMRLSAGESKQGGRRRESVLGDAMEAILAAVYFDGGLDVARQVFDVSWAAEFQATPTRAVTNPKSVLQEWALKLGRALPVYRVVDRSGSDHAPTFTVEAVVEDVDPLTATGRSRQEAEKAAATAMLKREGVI